MDNYDFFTRVMIIIGLLAGMFFAIGSIIGMSFLNDTLGISMQTKFLDLGPIRIQLWLVYILTPIITTLIGWGIGKIIDTIILNIFGTEGYQKTVNVIGIVLLMCFGSIGAVIGYTIPETIIFKIIGAVIGIVIGIIVAFKIVVGE